MIIDRGDTVGFRLCKRYSGYSDSEPDVFAHGTDRGLWTFIDPNGFNSFQNNAKMKKIRDIYGERSYMTRCFLNQYLFTKFVNDEEYYEKYKGITKQDVLDSLPKVPYDYFSGNNNVLYINYDESSPEKLSYDKNSFGFIGSYVYTDEQNKEMTLSIEYVNLLKNKEFTNLLKYIEDHITIDVDDRGADLLTDKRYLSKHTDEKSRNTIEGILEFLYSSDYTTWWTIKDSGLGTIENELRENLSEIGYYDLLAGFLLYGTDEIKDKLERKFFSNFGYHLKARSFIELSNLKTIIDWINNELTEDNIDTVVDGIMDGTICVMSSEMKSRTENQ